MKLSFQPVSLPQNDFCKRLESDAICPPEPPTVAAKEKASRFVGKVKRKIPVWFNSCERSEEAIWVPV